MDSGKRVKLMDTPTPKKGRKVPPRATPIDPVKDVKLPMVRSYGHVYKHNPIRSLLLV
jgi:hypothetical protein